MTTWFTLKIPHSLDKFTSPSRIPRKSLGEGLVPLMSNQDGKGVVIEEIMEDDEVKEASKTRNNGKPLFDHPPWSSESMNEKRNKRLSEECKFRKLLFDTDLLVHNDFHPLMYEDDLLQQEDPVNYQQDPYHEEDEAEENAELFDELDHLLEHVPFLKETDVVVDGDAPLLAVDAPVIVLEE
ncbi:hypothetical protein Tco_0658294 [Tanacetum coccineum]